MLDPARLLRRNIQEGPKFADELDDRIKYSYRYKTTSCITYSESWLDCDTEAWGLDYFFPPGHLIPFKREENEDIFLTLQEPPEVEKAFLDRFKQKVKDSVKQGVELPVLDDLDRLQLFGGAKTFDSSSLKKSTRTEQRSERPSLELADEFLYKYTFVQKTAAEDRAAVIAS
jgi:hypothetical protein